MAGCAQVLGKRLDTRGLLATEESGKTLSLPYRRTLSRSNRPASPCREMAAEANRLLEVGRPLAACERHRAPRLLYSMWEYFH